MVSNESPATPTGGGKRSYCNRRIATVAALGSLVLAVAACSSTTGAKSTKDQGGDSGSSGSSSSSFYKGKTITWVLPVAANSSFYQQATILVPEMQKILGATINLTSNASGAGIPGQDIVASAPSNGLMMGTLSLNNDVLEKIAGQPSVNFDVAKMQMLGCVPLGPNIMLASPGSSYRTFDDLRSATSQVKVITHSGTSDVNVRVILGAYGVNAKFITGYNTGADASAGFLRGDAPIYQDAIGSSGPVVVAGKGTPLLVSRVPPAGAQGYEQLKNTPTFNEYAASNQPPTAAGQAAMKTLDLLNGSSAPNGCPFLPANAPAEAVSELTNAFKTALNDPANTQAQLKQALIPGYYSPDQVRQVLASVTTNADTIKPYLAKS
ncbi:hypothetical protein ACSMXN_05365 [Jatrophihabitans sp. DSM 45814]